MAQPQQLVDETIEELREGEETQRVAGGRGVDDDTLEVHAESVSSREGDHLQAVAARFCATHRYGRIDARCAELVAAGILDRNNVLRRGLLFDALHRDRVVRGGGAVSVVQIGAFDGVMDDPVFECVTSRER